MNIYDKAEFIRKTGVTLSDHYFNCVMDDFALDDDATLSYDEFLKDWLIEQEDNLIKCHREDFDRLEEENKIIAAELKRLKNKIYSLAVSDGIISFSVTSSAV